MSLAQHQSRRVLIVGAKFGELYLNAFLHLPAGFELAGLLAQGSARAQQLAQAFGIPLYTDLSQVPEGIEIACIVVRSTVVSGAGTQLAKACLARGMHVIQEHPVHPDEMDALAQTARTVQRDYWVNSFYPYTPAGRQWIEDATRIQQQLGQAPYSADLTTSRQLLYSTLDLWCQATQAQAVSASLVSDQDPHFHLFQLRGHVAGMQGALDQPVTATLKLQRYLDPADPDLHSLVMHRQSLIWPEGYLSLEASYGPVMWTSSLYLPDHTQQSQSLYQLSAVTSGQRLHQPVTQCRYTAPADWRACFELEGPKGVAYLLTQLGRALHGQAADRSAHHTSQREIAILWQRILQQAGPAETRTLPAPVCLTSHPNGWDVQEDTI